MLLEKAFSWPAISSRILGCQMVYGGSRFGNNWSSAGKDYWEDIKGGLSSRIYADQDGNKRCSNKNVSHTCNRWGSSLGKPKNGESAPDA
jgi:hypothetical protein